MHTSRVVLFTFLVFNIMFAADPDNNTERNETKDFSLIERKLLCTYLSKCEKQVEKFNHLKKRFEQEGTCGFCSTPGIHFKTKTEDDIVVIETTVWGQRDEFEQPEATFAQREQETLKALLINHIAQNKETDSTITVLSEHTKCQAPVYYDKNRGWMRCFTFITSQELKALRAELQNEERSEYFPDDASFLG